MKAVMIKELGTNERTNKENYYLKMAAVVAATSKCRFRLGCVVVKHGKILGVSPNIRKNDPQYTNWKFSSIHAEVRALRRANFPERATIFVARVSNIGIRCAKPCEGCMSLINELKCKVVYT